MKYYKPYIQLIIPIYPNILKYNIIYNIYIYIYKKYIYIYKYKYLRKRKEIYIVIKILLLLCIIELSQYEWNTY